LNPLEKRYGPKTYMLSSIPFVSPASLRMSKKSIHTTIQTLELDGYVALQDKLLAKHLSDY